MTGVAAFDATALVAATAVLVFLDISSFALSNPPDPDLGLADLGVSISLLGVSAVVAPTAVAAAAVHQVIILDLLFLNFFLRSRIFFQIFL